jgi:hypothetical protein
MQEFTIAPAGLKPLWTLLPVALILTVVMAGLALSLAGSRQARFEVSSAGLRLRGDFYGRLVPATAIQVAAARRADLAADGTLRPVRRTWGTGLPGYRAGWFRLANGERALLYLTDDAKAVYVPTTLGYALLLSPDDPDRFLQALRGAAVPAAQGGR